MRSSSASTKIREAEGGGAPNVEAEIPLQPAEETTVGQRFPCSNLSGEDYAEADTHTAACEELHSRAAGCAQKDLKPLGSSHWSRFILKDCSAQRGLTLEQG